MFQGSALRSPCGKTGITLRGTVPPKVGLLYLGSRVSTLDIIHVIILRLKKVYRYFVTLSTDSSIHRLRRLYRGIQALLSVLPQQKEPREIRSSQLVPSTCIPAINAAPSTNRYLLLQSILRSTTVLRRTGTILSYRFQRESRGIPSVMAAYRLPPITTLPSLPTAELATILDHLFEPSVPLHTLSVDLLRDQPFSSYDDLVASIGVQLTHLAESSSTSDSKWLESILGAHPRLGEKKIDSTQSKAEQAQLALDAETGQDKLSELNSLYERTFPGLRYV